MVFNQQAHFKSNLHNKKSPKNTLCKKSAGFTLVEVIIGIVVLSIALTIISSLIIPTEEKSADNILQIKAAELGQSFLNDITSRAFDHNSDMAGGRYRCGEPDANGDSNLCTSASDFGFESIDGEVGGNSSTFNDVDDFHGYTAHTGAQGSPLDASYDSFILEVEVEYAGADLGLDNELAKRITVTVTTPLGTKIKFATHKANF